MTVKSALLVDDEADLLDALAFAVRHIGFHALEAHDGAQALALLAEYRPDVVVTDVRMPGGSGSELFDRARATLAALPPFVISTGFADLLPETLYAQGIEAILMKPFELIDLQDALRRVTTPIAERWAQPPREGIARSLRLDAGQVALGRGGFFAALAEPLRAGEHVRFHLDLEGGEVAGAGIVRWTRSHREPGCGVELLSVVDPEALLARLPPPPLRAFIPASVR